MGTINPPTRPRSPKAERCLSPLDFKGLLINTSWHAQFIDGEDAFAFSEWAQDRQVPLFIHPYAYPSAPTGRWTSTKLDELVGRPFDTAMTLARMILARASFDPVPAPEDLRLAYGRQALTGHGPARFRLAARLRRHARARKNSLPGIAEQLSRKTPRRHDGVLGATCVRRGGRGVRRRARRRSGTDSGGTDRFPGAHRASCKDSGSPPPSRRKSCGATRRHSSGLKSPADSSSADGPSRRSQRRPARVKSSPCQN